MLTSVGASATAGGLSISEARADESIDTLGPMCDASKKYKEANEIEDLINQYNNFLATLCDEGYLEEKQINIEEILSADDYFDSKNGTSVWGFRFYEGHIGTPHITVRRELADGRLVIALDPEIDNGISAIIKPHEIINTDEPGMGHEVNLIISDEIGDEPDIVTTEYIPKSPQEIDSDYSIQGIVIYGCKQYGEYGCTKKDCQRWEGTCYGGDCRWLECTEEICCGGCCCCEDETYCCQVCGGDCSHLIDCDEFDETCYNGGCCDCCY